jgi:hypothetical protein
VAIPRPRTVPWVEDIPRRIKLDASARTAYPDLTFARRQLRGKGAVYVYEVTLDVPGYEPRKVRVDFHANMARTPRIFADGPTSSPHRYGAHRLCIWYPGDEDKQRWVPADGLLALLGMTATHLFKEAYWRETGDWLGDEAPHGTLSAADEVESATGSAKMDPDATPNDEGPREETKERRRLP